jgi:rhodanese-related sulfurtransferase/plastocyanin
MPTVARTLFVAALALSCALFARAEESTPAVPAPVELYSPQRLIETLQGGQRIVFLDVREPSEFKVNHLPGALNIPERLLEERKAELPTDALLVPYCNMDFRGYVAATKLQSMGFKVALMQERGLQGWQEQGLPIVESKKGGLDDATALARLQTVSPQTLLGVRFLDRVKPTGVTRKLTMTVSEWYFDPNDLAVDAGDRVEIDVLSDKGTHYFVLPDYEVQTRIPQGETRTVSFIADRAGTFRFGTCEWDGGALQVMKGRLKVRTPVR